MPFKSFDIVKFAAIEGSSLTLLGLVKYSADSDTIEMTQLYYILSGGV